MLTPSRRQSIAAFVAASLAIAFSFFFIAKRSSHKDTGSKSLPSAAKSLGANGPVAAVAGPELMKAYGQLPLSFEANRGQSAADVKYLSRGEGYFLSLRSQEADLTFRQSPAARAASNRLKLYRTHRAPTAPEKFSTLRMHLDGSNPGAGITGLDRTATKVNYFIGNDPKKWHSDVPAYSKVKYADIYPGVDLMFYGNRRELEYDFVVAPGADPRSIVLNVAGARKVYLDARGNLMLDVTGGEVKIKKPDVYQDSNGTRHEVAGNYTIKNHHEVRFAVADYDRTQPLTIDPVVTYSTYVGGSGIGANGGDMATGIALDSAGDAYIGGVTFSADLKQVNGITPTAPMSVTTGGSTGFVAELNPTGTAALYLTYLGGSTGVGTQDGIQAIAVDAGKNIYVTGFTQSSDFPLSTTNTPFEPTAPVSINSQGSAFVTRLDPTQAGGAQLVYSSYLGGSGNLDQGNGIAVDANGNAYVTGVTQSTNFPTANATTAPFSAILFSPEGNAFVTEVNTHGSGQASLLFSSYLGGTGAGNNDFIYGDSGAGITVDSSSNAYIVGTTTSADFPTQGTQIIANGCAKNPTSAVFIVKIGLAAPTTPAFSYSTCLAGTTADVGSAIALGPNNLVYLTGATFSADFPVTPHTIPLGFPGTPPVGFPRADDSVAFVSTVNTTNGTLGYSTLLGGSNGDGGFGIAADSAGVAYVTGQAASPNFPTTPGALQSARSNILGSVFVSKINASAGGQGGADLLYSTYYGGNGDGTDPDSGNGIAVSGTNAYFGGQATAGLSTTAGAYQTATKNPAGVNAFVAELPLIATLTVTPSSLAFGNQLVTTMSAPPMTVTITNNSGVTLPVTFTVTGLNAGDFAAVPGAAMGCGVTLAAAATCTIDVVFTPTVMPAGAELGILTIGTAPNTVAVALTGTGSATGDFSLTVPTTFNLTSGVAGSIPVMVNGIGGFAGMVNLACTAGTNVTSCTIPAAANVGDTVQAMVTGTVAVVMQPETVKTPPSVPMRQVLFLILGIGTLFMIPMTQRFKTRLGVAVAMLVFVVVAGCSGGSSPHTAMGTVTIVGTGTGAAAGITHSYTVNLTITK